MQYYDNKLNISKPSKAPHRQESLLKYFFINHDYQYQTIET